MANMHVSEIGRHASPPPVAADNNPVAEVSATMLRAQTFTGATGVGLLIREDDALICRAATGTGAPDFGARVPLEGTFLGLCARSKKPERTEDAETDLRVENASYGRVRPKSILAVPVRTDAEGVGVLAVFSTSASAFNNTHVAILRTMSDAIVRIVTKLPAIPAAPSAAETATPSQPDKPAEMVVTKPAPATPEKKAETVIPMPAPPAPEKKAETVITKPVAAAPEKKTETVIPMPAPAPPKPVATLAKPPEPLKPTPAPEARVLKMPEPVAPPPPAAVAPTEPRKSDNDLLTLADDPGPRVTIRTLPPLPKTIEPPKFTTQAPFFDLPRPSRRRRRMRNRVIAASFAVLFAATLGYGAFATRSQAEPKFAAAHPAVPEIFNDQLRAVQAKAASAAAAAAAKDSVTAAAVSTAVIEAPAPEPVRTPSATTEVRPLAKSTNVAEVQAPQLPLAASPTIPAIPAIGFGLSAAKPEMRQSQVTRPQLVQKVAPEYPMAALRAKAAGEVKLTAVIRKDGSVGDVKVISGNPLLRDSAVEAVKQWRYYPGTLDGRAIESTAEIVLKFAAPR